MSRARGGGALCAAGEDMTVASGSTAAEFGSPRSRVVGCDTLSRTFAESNCTVSVKLSSTMNSNPPSCVQNFWVSVAYARLHLGQRFIFGFSLIKSGIEDDYSLARAAAIFAGKPALLGSSSKAFS